MVYPPGPSDCSRLVRALGLKVLMFQELLTRPRRKECSREPYSEDSVMKLVRYDCVVAQTWKDKALVGWGLGFGVEELGRRIHT